MSVYETVLNEGTSTTIIFEHETHFINANDNREFTRLATHNRKYFASLYSLEVDIIDDSNDLSEDFKIRIDPTDNIAIFDYHRLINVKDIVFHNKNIIIKCDNVQPINYREYYSNFGDTRSRLNNTMRVECDNKILRRNMSDNQITLVKDVTEYFFNKDVYDSWFQTVGAKRCYLLDEIISTAEEQIIDNRFIDAEVTIDNGLCQFPEVIQLHLGKFFCKYSISYTGSLFDIEFSDFNFSKLIDENLMLDPLLEQIMMLAKEEYMKYFSLAKRLESIRMDLLKGNRFVNFTSDINKNADYSLVSADESIGNHYRHEDETLIVNRFDNEIFKLIIASDPIKRIIINNGVTDVPSGVFSHLTTLKEVHLSDSVKTIGAFSFMGCYNLESVRMSSILETIGNYAFDGCKNLANISLPISLKSIGNYAFSHYKNGYLEVRKSCNVGKGNYIIQKER